MCLGSRRSEGRVAAAAGRDGRHSGLRTSRSNASRLMALRFSQGLAHQTRPSGKSSSASGRPLACWSNCSDRHDCVSSTDRAASTALHLKVGVPSTPPLAIAGTQRRRSRGARRGAQILISSAASRSWRRARHSHQQSSGSRSSSSPPSRGTCLQCRRSSHSRRPARPPTTHRTRSPCG